MSATNIKNEYTPQLKSQDFLEKLCTTEIAYPDYNVVGLGANCCFDSFQTISKPKGKTKHKVPLTEGFPSMNPVLPIW